MKCTLIRVVTSLVVSISVAQAVSPARSGPEVEAPDFVKHQASFHDLIETRRQAITVTFTTPTVAKRADVSPLPLYGGAEWAVTSRWDDNCLADLKTRAVLLDHGHRGTFFLNDPARSFYGKDYGLMGDHPSRDLGRLLSKGGTTVGGHSLTHPMLTYQNRNRIFEEVLGCRIALEAAFDTPVNAYAFSFCNFVNSVEGAYVERAIATALARAGYLQVANHRFAENGAWPWGVAALLPPDGRPIDHQFATFLADEDLKKENPCITYSMHSWYDSTEEWAGFKSDLNRYGGRPEWWYCNQNEYGAYRAQYRSAARGKAEVEDRKVTFVFDWPALIDLNDPVPLTFEISGVKSSDVVEIKSPGARIERTDVEGAPRFHVHSGGDRRMPRRIDHVATDDGRIATSAKFPSLSGALKCDGERLTLSLRNGGTEPLEICRVTYRLPPRYRSGVVRRTAFELARGSEHGDVVPLEEAHNGGRYRAGVYYFAAQIDVTVAGTSGRIYFTTHRDGSLDDASYPQRGFTILGPIPRAEFDPASLPPDVIRANGWTSPQGRELTFAPVNGALAKPLNGEVIPVRGRWDNRDLEPCVYLLRSTVHSPQERSVRLLRQASTVTAVWLNGRRCRGEATLNSGENDLLLVYEPPHEQRFSPEHAGPMFRIGDAHTNERLQDLRYSP